VSVPFSETNNKMSTPEFTIPTKPEDLAHEDCTAEVRVSNLKELKELSADDTKTFAHGEPSFITYTNWQSKCQSQSTYS